MDSTTCALCDRAILRSDRVILLGLERLMLHGACYDEVRQGLTGEVPRWRRLERLRLAARDQPRT